MKGCLIAAAVGVVLLLGGVMALFASGYEAPVLDRIAGDGDVGVEVTPSGTPLATVAVGPDDTIASCMERNVSPALLLSLYRGQTTLSNDIIRTCLRRDIPPELVGLIDPIIRQTSTCASETSRTLTAEEVLILGQAEGTAEAEKGRIIRRFVRDTLECVADVYGIPIR